MDCSQRNPHISYSVVECQNCNCTIEDAVKACCFQYINDRCKLRNSANIVDLKVRGYNATDLTFIGDRCCHVTIGYEKNGKGKSKILPCNTTEQRHIPQTASYSSKNHQRFLNTSFQHTSHTSTRQPSYTNDKTQSRLKSTTEVGETITSTLDPTALPILAFTGFAVILGLIFSLVLAIEWRRKKSKRRNRTPVGIDNQEMMLGNASASNAVSEYSTIDDILSLPLQLPHFSDDLDAHSSPDVRHVTLFCKAVCSEPGKNKISHLSSDPNGTINVNIPDDINNDVMIKSSTSSSAKESTTHNTCAFVDDDGYLASRDLIPYKKEKSGTSFDLCDNPYQSINDVDDSNESPVSNAKKVQDVNLHVLIRDEITNPERAATLKISDIVTSKSEISVKKSNYFILEPIEYEASVCFTGTCTRQESQYNSIEEIETDKEISQMETEICHYHRFGSPQSELEIIPCTPDLHLITDEESYLSLEKSAEHQSINNDENYFSLEESAGHQSITTITNDENYFSLEKRKSLTFDIGQYDHLQRNKEHTQDDDLPSYMKGSNNNGQARTIYDSNKTQSAYFQLEKTHPISKSVVGRKLKCGEDEAGYLTPIDVRRNPSNAKETFYQLHSDMSITPNMSNFDKGNTQDISKSRDLYHTLKETIPTA